MSSAIAASIKARLLNVAKKREEEFELFLVRYVCERFLYRLGASKYRTSCTLKGAWLLALWMDDPYRATRDVDLLASGDSDESTIRTVVKTICEVPCPEDGLVFDLSSLAITPIREGQSYAGQRAVMQVFLGTAKTRLQVDIGFGDAVFMGPEQATFPTLLDHLPAPVVQAYPQVSTIAEKFEAMVQLGRRTSRMKDFHDLWALSDAFEFEGTAIQEAISQCFARRDTPWTIDVPDALTSAFYLDGNLTARWRAYLNSGRFRVSPPEDFTQVGKQIQAFISPVRESIVAGIPFYKHWPIGGPWGRA